MSFADSGLDVRLLRALGKLGLTTPTLVQQACIPEALKGKDVVARARCAQTHWSARIAHCSQPLNRIVYLLPGVTARSVRCAAVQQNAFCYFLLLTSSKSIRAAQSGCLRLSCTRPSDCCRLLCAPTQANTAALWRSSC